ncbi:CbtA family protein [Aureimonas altamirensis]|uniref:CbtA family protein n=1 Tax=Aureimonas altamirensis TaxID=370622 RepID=UPI00301B47C0
MLARTLIAALLAGMLAGLAITPVQSLKTTPLILAAEVFEDGGAPAHDHAAGLAFVTPAMAHGGEDEESATLVASRLGGTAMANMVLGAGFALLLAAASLAFDRPLTARNGAVWGLAGFAVLTLAPAMGLPPELPAMPAADLGARQAWWLMAVLCTGGGLAGLVLSRRTWQRLLGLVLIAAPLFIPAPHPAELASPIPPSLAAEFAVASLATSALFWVLIGLFSGLVLDAIRRTAIPRPA